MAPYSFVFVLAMAWASFFFVPVGSIIFNTTVSLDGTGDFKTIGAAISAAPDNLKSRYYIHVKSGTYRERVEVPETKRFIALIGDNVLTTIIIDNRSNGTKFKTSDSATLTVMGDNFMAQMLSFENSGGPQNFQAVAVLDKADHTSYYKCRFLGFQDTLYLKGRGQFFKECDIYGTVDFIFGSGLGMFQDCNIFARAPNKSITVTAQSNEDPLSRNGFAFQNCSVTTSPEVISDKNSVTVYLGRPWKEYSKVIFMESFLDSIVLPRGWLEWEGIPVNHLYYAEYENRGPGAEVSKRVNWTGFHVLSKELAFQFTVDKFINASDWLPETGVPFRSGLIS